MISITSELRRRQRVFKEVGEKLGMSNLDIHKYQKLYREGKVDQPMQHLIIVSDEFAELKQQEPQFMDDLVSAARIGRSLGVHLILATQKPSGVVNDQITSNTRFRVCLKVQDKGDSMEMLARPEAAMLTKTGRYYLQVGFNEVFQLGQSAYSGAPSVPQERYVEQPDNTIEVLDNLGSAFVKAKIPDPSDNIKREKQVDELVKYCRSVAEKEGLIPEMIWKPMLEAYKLLDDIDKEYPVEFTPFSVDPVVGLADDPYSQTQFPLRINFAEGGNAIVYGITGSGKSEFVSAVIYSLCRHHTPTDVNIYCLDFASEGAKMFSHMPHVGDVVVSGEDEKVNNLMNHLSDEMARRRKILSAYGGALNVYRMENPNVPMPSVLIIVDNYQAFGEMYEEYDELMYQIVREGPRFGIYTLITAISSTAVRYRMSQNFKQVFCLQMPDKADYSLLLGSKDGAIPVNRVGSGVYKNEKVLEFQVGRILPEETVNVFKEVQDLSRKMAAQWKGGRAQRIKTLPETVTVRDVLEGETVSLASVPVGMEREKLTTVSWNLEDRFINAVMYADEPEFPFVSSLAEVLSRVPGAQVLFIDAMGTLEKPQNEKILYFEKKRSEDGVKQAFYEVLKRHNDTKTAKDEGRAAPVYEEC
ncbi:MAG: type VII secretion protein EssC, partial [Clostridia bacterium]|nr:type VII secretion protein EssC [Clostridia bacterium]